MKVWVLQHNAFETLGTIATALDAAGLQPAPVATYAGESVPPLGDAAGLIIMGGPMGVYEADRYPYLRDELRLIAEALAADVPVLGICLGSQLLAAALGAEVVPGPSREIGWHPVTLRDAAATDPLWGGVEPVFTAFHWHGDVFDLPAGAVSLASSAQTEHQAFRYGEAAYGLLFHPEVTPEIIGGMVGTFDDELRRERLVGRDILAEVDRYLPPLQRIGSTVFTRWAALCRQPRRPSPRA